MLRIANTDVEKGAGKSRDKNVHSNSVSSAPQGETQSGAHLIHSCGTKLGYSFPSRCCDTVTALCRFTVVLLIQNDFRGHTANRECDGRNRDRG